MVSYFSTFISGCQNIVNVALKKKLEDVKIELLLDGLVVYKTNKEIEKVKDLRFLHNTFILFKYFNEPFTTTDLIKHVLQHPKIIPYVHLKDVSSFRVIASRENQLVTINKKMLVKTETFLASKLCLKIDRTSPDTEVWFLTRNEGCAFIGLRITKKPNYEKILHKGELRPELANIMCVIADIKPTDIVLDPFAGYGSIPIECVKYFEVEKVFAGEKDKKVFEVLRNKSKEIGNRLVVGKWNALNITALTDNKIDKIITDPPWGIYENIEINIDVYYKNMLKEFSRLLKNNGKVIILTAQKKIFEKLIEDFTRFKLLKKYSILVSGKKASIYKIKKI